MLWLILKAVYVIGAGLFGAKMFDNLREPPGDVVCAFLGALGFGLTWPVTLPWFLFISWGEGL